MEYTMIVDSDLLRMLMEKYPTHDPAFIMGEFSTYKKLLAELETTPQECTCAAEPAPAVEESEPAPAPVKKLTKRQIKGDPAAAITQTAITCCVCGKEFKRLSAAHLATHGATPEEYRRLCGYDPSTPLMSKIMYQRLMNAVQKAQSARVRKRAMTGGTEEL